MSPNQELVPRITGLLILEVRKSNPNGDPERESSPRQRPDGKRGDLASLGKTQAARPGPRETRSCLGRSESIAWNYTK